MALRLQCTFYANEVGTEYTISIYDEEYSGAVVDFTTDGNGFTINWQGEGQKMKVPISTSKCDVNIVVDTASIESFVTDINSAYEGQLRLAITNTSGGVWYGHILPDLVQLEDKPLENKPLFRLSATDGIKRLQTIAYKDTDGPYEGEETILGHLLNCVNKIGLTDLMTDFNYVLGLATNWVPASIVAGDVMRYTSFEHRALYRVDDKGNYQYNSVYRVIEQICLRFHARFIMMDGAYRFWQHNIHESDSLSEYRYQANGTALINSLLTTYTSVGSTFPGKFGRGFYGWFAALNFAQINYLHFGYTNLAKGYIWTQASQPTIPESPTVYRVDNDTAFTFRATFDYTISATGAKPRYTKFNFQFQVDTNYLKRESTPGNGIYNAPEEIVSSSDTYDLSIETPVVQYDPNITPVGQGIMQVEFTTIEFPAGGNLAFTIGFENCFDNFGNVISSGLDVRWRFSNVELIPLSNSDTSSYVNTKSVTGFNAVAGNSEKEVVNLIIGQELGYGRLRVDDGAGGTDGIDWGVGATSSGQSIEELLAKEYIRTQAVPVRKMITNYLGPTYSPLLALRHGSNNWIFYKGKFYGNREYYDGEWRLLDTTGTTSNNTEVDWVVDDIDGDGNEVITIVNPGGGGGGTPSPGDDNSTNPDTPGVNVVLDSLFPRTTDDIDSGTTVSGIPVEARPTDGEYKAGQTVRIIDPYSGAYQDFEIETDSTNGATVLNVVDETASFPLPEGSWILTSQTEQQAASGSSGFYRQEFAAHASATITVTVANLPTNPAAIRVYYDNGMLLSYTYWSHTGNVITLNFTPDGGQSIWVEFAT